MTVYAAELTPRIAKALLRALNASLPFSLPIVALLNTPPIQHARLYLSFPLQALEEKPAEIPFLLSAAIVQGNHDLQLIRFFCSTEAQPEEDVVSSPGVVDAHVTSFMREWIPMLSRDLGSWERVMIGTLHHRWVSSLETWINYNGPCTKYTRDPSPSPFQPLPERATLAPLELSDVERVMETSHISRPAEYIISRAMSPLLSLVRWFGGVTRM